jgi:RNA polymerase-interacting CarD/CdnL/TRCF family regulator
MNLAEKEHAHELIERLEPSQIAAVVHLLEVMVHDDDEEELTEEDRRALRASQEYFRRDG